MIKQFQLDLIDSSATSTDRAKSLSRAGFYVRLISGYEAKAAKEFYPLDHSQQDHYSFGCYLINLDAQIISKGVETIKKNKRVFVSSCRRSH